jgi:hypothetical protein
MGLTGDETINIGGRPHQITPVLEPEDVYRLSRYGEVKTDADGEALFLTACRVAAYSSSSLAKSALPAAMGSAM